VANVIKRPKSCITTTCCVETICWRQLSGEAVVMQADGCLDKNYGGVLIVFDRLLGTFIQAPTTLNPLWIAFDQRQKNG